MGLLSELFKLFAGALEDDVLLGGQGTKKTLCCGVKMWDVWTHSKTCIQTLMAEKRYREWRESHPTAGLTEIPNFVKPYGTIGEPCEECGYPIGMKELLPAGPYVVGKACPYCGYIERRKPR